MVFTGGWRVFVGALVLSASVVAPATASAEPDPVACRSWDVVELPVPPAVQFGGVAAAAGSYAVGNGSFSSTYGSTVLLWKDGQQVKQLSFFRSTVAAVDVSSSGVVLLSSSFSQAASRWHDDGSQDGVYQALQGLPGEYQVQATALNERGDALGTSNGKPVVWPAGPRCRNGCRARTRPGRCRVSRTTGRCSRRTPAAGTGSVRLVRSRLAPPLR